MALFDKYKRRFRLFALACWQAGWRAVLLLALGALAACGFEPLHLWPLALCSVAVLGWLVSRAQGWRQAGLVGWLWGVGHFTLGLNWIATAFTYQAKMPAALGSLAVLGLSLYLALYPALACGVLWLCRRLAVARVAGFAGAWITCELLRGWVFTGFPWNPLGAVLLGDHAHAGLAGLAPWLGTYGLSGLTALLAMLMAEGARRIVAGHRLRGAVWVALPLALVALAMVWPAPVERKGAVAFTLVQPNVAQEDLDDPAHFDQQFRESARLSAPLAAGARLVLWPESGVPDYVRDGYPAWYYQYTFAGDPWMARLRLARAIGTGGVLLTGSVDLDFKGMDAVGGRNVITGIDDHGRIMASYAKAHLVPYGEYLPMRGLLEPLGLARLVPGDIDFAAGPGPRTLDLGPLGKAGMQICYEIIFSGQVVDPAHRPDYIFNPSNDGWFGAWGPPQHLAQARLRAIEEGLPLLRSTTNGISAVVDADGIVRAAVPRGVAGRIDAVVPLAHAPTWFARAGLMLALGLSVFLLGLAALVLRRPLG